MAITFHITPSDDDHNVSAKAEGNIKEDVSKEHLVFFKITDGRIKKTINKLKMKEDNTKGNHSVSAHFLQVANWLDCITKHNWDSVKVVICVSNIEIINVKSEQCIAASHRFTNNSKKPATLSADIQDGLDSIRTSWERKKDLGITKIDYKMDVLGCTGVSYPSNWVSVELDPGKKAVSNLRVKRYVVKLKVGLDVSLEGDVSCSFVGVFKRINRKYGVADVLKAANLPTSVTASEEISICFYTDGALTISNRTD